MKMNLNLEEMPLNELLRTKRRIENLTQVELLNLIGLSLHDANVLSRFENGHIEKLPKRFIEPINNYLYGEEGVEKNESIGV